MGLLIGFTCEEGETEKRPGGMEDISQAIGGLLGVVGQEVGASEKHHYEQDQRRPKGEGVFGEMKQGD